MVQLLLTANVDPNKLDKYGDAPLHWAAKRGHRAVAQALIEGKAEVSIKAKHGETPLHWAAKRGLLTDAALQRAEMHLFAKRVRPSAALTG